MQWAAIGAAFTGILNSKAFRSFMVLLIVGVIVYFIYKKIQRSGGYVQYPDNGTGIPVGWSPVPTVELLEDAFHGGWFFGAGTSEKQIWEALGELTPDQLAAVYNQYYKKYGVKLEDEFKDELSGDDLTRALQIFAPVLR